MQKRLIPAFLFILLSFVTFSSFSIGTCASPRPEEIQDLREGIIALNKICMNALDTLSKASVKKTMSKKDRYEYRMYIAYLKGRIERYCERLSMIGGQNATAGLPCSQKTYLSFPAQQGSESKTTAEQISELDHELLSSLGNFDEELLRESERLKAITPRQRASSEQSVENDHGKGTSKTGGAESKGSGGIKTGKEGVSSNTSEKTKGSEQGKNTEERNGNSVKGHDEESGKGKSVSSSKGTGYPANRQGPGVKAGNHGKDTGTSATNTDTLSADDDIVARQLREAAEKETDPELKKRLWEEYRRYKEGK